MDCDIYVLGSFKKICEMNLENYYCAGVLCLYINDTLKNDLLYFDVEYYINAGFLLILEKWCTMNVEIDFVGFIPDNEGKFFLEDYNPVKFIYSYV